MAENGEIEVKDGVVAAAATGIGAERKQAVVLQFYVKGYRDGISPMTLVSTKYEDYCSELVTNNYLNIIYRSGEIPKTCDLKKGEYPAHVVYNYTFVVPNLPNMFTGVILMNAKVYDSDEQTVFCANGRAEISVTRN